MHRVLRVLSVVCILLFNTVSFAAEVQPDELIKQTSEKVLDALEKNKEQYAEQPEELSKLVNDIILPHLDFRAMSKLALGKNWRKANDDQQLRFVDAFKSMLIRTYSKSLTEYAGQEIKFSPYRPPAEGKRTTKVKTVILPVSKAVFYWPYLWLMKLFSISVQYNHYQWT